MKKVGEFVPDKLFAGTEIKVLTKGIVLKQGQGILSRGTVLKKDNQEYVIVAASTDQADCILTDMVDTDENQVATAYITGLFNKKSLIFENGVTYDDMELHMRRLGIFAVDVLE